MASDANGPPNPADQDNRFRNCAKCNAEMQQLGAFPALSIHPALKIFRCYACDHVVEERT
jgi:hypothetical protein